jgi:predicted acetyltransferase
MTDEKEAVRAHSLAVDFDFLKAWTPSQPWEEFLLANEDHRNGRNLPEGWVRSVQLVAEVEGQLVGRANLRFLLKDNPPLPSGHIGYGVLPHFRGRGFATQICERSVELLKEEGVRPIQITCGQNNHASARVIEKCGGVYSQNFFTPQGIESRRCYYIDY